MTTAIQTFLKFRGVRGLAVASSALASQLLGDERTAHTALKIPIPVHSQSTCSIEASPQLVGELIDTKLIVWDEFVMTHRHTTEAVDRILKNFLYSVLLSGAIVIL